MVPPSNGSDKWEGQRFWGPDGVTRRNSVRDKDGDRETGWGGVDWDRPVRVTAVAHFFVKELKRDRTGRRDRREGAGVEGGHLGGRCARGHHPSCSSTGVTHHPHPLSQTGKDAVCS